MTRTKKPAAPAAETLPATEKVAGVTETAQPASDGVGPASGDDTIIAPPVAQVVQSGAEASNRIDPAAAAATAFVSGVSMTALRPTDSFAIASQLVAGNPNPDLVEAVRQVLAGEAVNMTAAIVPDAAIVPGAAARRGHVALMHLDLDGKSYAPFDTVFVTEDEFDPLKDATVFDGWWDEGVVDGGQTAE